MNAAVATFRHGRRTQVAGSAEARERAIRRRVAITWGLLVFNVLTYGGYSVLPIPYRIGQAITQASLQVALIVALTVNRRLIVRPNVFLCLVSLLVVAAVITMEISPLHRGIVYRTFRLAEFVAVLWLLTPWWGRRDLLLVRSHLAAMTAVLGSVLLGVVVSPSQALTGRLGGVVWPIPSTQVAHYAAVTTGMVAVLWLCGLLRGKTTLLAVVAAGTILIMTHTRTALLAMVVGVIVAGLSLFVATARARRVFATTVVVAAIMAATLSSFITKWLARGQGTTQLLNLSGRTNVWGPLLAFPRDRLQEIFGFGLSNSSFNGLPIDSNWLASYDEQGLIGVTLCAMILLFLILAAAFQTNKVRRALALFLVIYCLIASYTEVGFTDASTYLLDLTLAASLLVPPIVRARSKGPASPARDTAMSPPDQVPTVYFGRSSQTG